jgi:hypothetical protein
MLISNTCTIKSFLHLISFFFFTSCHPKWWTRPGRMARERPIKERSNTKNICDYIIWTFYISVQANHGKVVWNCIALKLVIITVFCSACVKRNKKFCYHDNNIQNNSVQLRYISYLSYWNGWMSVLIYIHSYHYEFFNNISIYIYSFIYSASKV